MANGSSNTWSIVSVIGVLAVLLLGLFGAFAGEKQVIPEQKDLTDYAKIDASIDAKLSAFENSFEAPVYEAPKYDNEKLNQIWEREYPTEISDLKAECLDAVQDEIKESKMKALLEKELGAEIDLISVSLDDEETDYDIVDLGLDEQDDRECYVFLEYKVKYQLEEGNTDRIRDIVYVKGHFFISDEDPEAEVEYGLKAFE